MKAIAIKRITQLLCVFAAMFASLATIPSSAGAVATGLQTIPGPDWSAYIALNRSVVGYFVDEQTCTGSLVSRYWVLTAAHCVTDETTTSTSRKTPEDQLVQQSWKTYDPKDFDLAIGRGDLDDSSAGFDTDVTEVQVHPQYRVFGVRRTGVGAVCGLDCRRLRFADNDYDLALLRLKKPAPVGTETISLATSPAPANGVMTGYGYGLTENGNTSRELRTTTFGSYKLDTCSYRDGEPADSECAKGTDEGFSRLQSGDSGGPWLAFLDGGLRQIGVHSTGTPTGDFITAKSTVVALDWIRRTANLPAESGDANAVGMAISIDSSGSMTSNDPSNRRLNAAEAYLTAAGGSDAVGIVDFDDSSRIASPARNPRTERDALVSAIRTIDSSGGTDIGAGVARACEVLENSGSQGSKAAILLTDGFGSYSDQNSCFKTKGWKLFTFGLGSSVDTTLLTRIAEETGGRYRSLPTTGDLVCEFQQVRALAAGGTAGDCTPTGVITLGQRIRKLVKVGRNLLQAVFSVSWPGSDVDLELTAPSGRVIKVDTDEFDVTAEETPTFDTITVAKPEPGEWAVNVIGVDVNPAGEPYSLSTVEVPLGDLPPEVKLTATEGTQSGEFKFSAAGSTDDHGIVDYIWDFGDGFSGSGANVQHTYAASGTYSVKLTVVDAQAASATASTTVEVKLNQPPDLSKVKPSKTVLWPPFLQFATVALTGATDPDGDAVKLTITGVTQDEKLGLLSPDARLCTDRAKVQLRAERDGFGDGRVYRVVFNADDGKGGTSTGTINVSVPHNIKRPAKDSAPPEYDSLAPPKGKGVSWLLSQLSSSHGGRC